MIIHEIKARAKERANTDLQTFPQGVSFVAKATAAHAITAGPRQRDPPADPWRAARNCTFPERMDSAKVSLVFLVGQWPQPSAEAGQCAMPEALGAVVTVAAGGRHTCAVTATSQLQC